MFHIATPTEIVWALRRMMMMVPTTPSRHNYETSLGRKVLPDSYYCLVNKDKNCVCKYLILITREILLINLSGKNLYISNFVINQMTN